MSDVDALWTPKDLDIREYTDTDLEATRVNGSRLYDTSGEVQALIEAYRHHSDLTDDSAIADRALRVEVAAWLDAAGPLYQRGDYDVAYTVPPEGWVDANCPQVTVSEITVTDPDSPHVNYTIPDVVYEMAHDAIDAGDYDGETEMVQVGLKQMLDL